VIRPGVIGPRVTRIAGSRLGAALAAAVLVLTPTSAGAIEPPEPPILFPDDPALQEAYEEGFTAGYDLGADDGFADGRSEARDQVDLRDEVADEAQATPTEEPVEGGRDLGDEIDPAPSPSASTQDPGTGQASAPTVVDSRPDESGTDIPWWPIAFAVAATAWFVTRRRIEDPRDE
jgi:hypothetical protein